MKIAQPKDAFQFFHSRLRGDVEEFWIAALNANKAVTASACLFRGTADHCLFHPRDVFRFALLHNAVSFIVAHNHPSGRIQPSPEDIEVTEQLLTISLIVQIPLTDHLIIGGQRYYSFMEKGRLVLNTTGLGGPSGR